MGKPIKILDLAKKMIQLSGKKIEEDIKVVITGLREVI
jgi:FlaA1/EpsC-like NDP-sugar epimerase